MKMLRSLVGNQFGKEVHLDRPPRTVGERIFRFSIYFFIIGSIAGGMAEFAGVDKKIGDSMGFLMWPFSALFMFSFIYMLAFAYARYVRPERAKRSNAPAASREPNQLPETTTASDRGSS